MNPEIRLQLYKVEADRLEVIISECSSLLKVCENATKAAEIRDAIQVTKTVLCMSCPVCKFVKKHGGEPYNPGLKCCPCWRRCRQFINFACEIRRRMRNIMGILTYRKNTPTNLHENWQVRSIKRNIESLTEMLSRVKTLIRKWEAKQND